MELNLIFLESFDTDFKGNIYKVYRFIDLQSLSIINGTNLKGEFKQYNSYKCIVEFSHNKLKVVSAQ